MAHEVLISYSSQDKLQADATCDRLESQGIRCWIAPRDVPPDTLHLKEGRARQSSRLRGECFWVSLPSLPTSCGAYGSHKTPNTQVIQPVEIPDVSDISEQRARNMPAEWGLKFREVMWEKSEKKYGVAIRTDPAPGETVIKNSEAILYVSGMITFPLLVDKSKEDTVVKDLKRIFEPFYTKKIMGRSGTGQGMAVVWGTVKDHDGYIDVQSREGLGSVFTLYFPVSREKLPKEDAPMVIEDYMGKGESILVVDDVEEQRDIARMLLERLGYSVTTVPSGEKAVDFMTKDSVDLLVLDMIMDPGIDGPETYKRILKLHPNQKAIIVSGFSETKRVKEAQKLGAGSYVRKPYLLEKIGKAVRGELDK